MKRKTKIMISALSVMLLMALSVTALSLSFADNSDLASQLIAEEQSVAAGTNDNYTNVDLIIENSTAQPIKDENGNTILQPDTKYHILEIGSATSASNLKTYASLSGAENPFGKYVLEGNRTLALKKPTGTIGDLDMSQIDYKFVNVSDVTADMISNADLIYVCHNSNAAFATPGNDLSEDAYDALHSYAIGNYKPLIIDAPQAKKIDNSTSKTVKELVEKVYAKSGYLYYTFAWKKSLGATGYLEHAQGSMYLGIKSNARSSKWLKLTNGTDPKNTARFLAVSVNGDKTDDTLALINAGTAATLHNDWKVQDTGEIVPDVYELATAGNMATNGYNTNYGAAPDAIAVEKVKLADIGTKSLDDYDMVVLEPDCGGQTISKDIYRQLSGAMYGNVHVTYDETFGTAATSSSGTGTANKTTNYQELFYLVAYEDNTSQYDNVMVTNSADFDEIVTSRDNGNGSVVANLINNSNYRGNGGGGQAGGSNKFTVLEIQPCYPIDLDVAQLQTGTSRKGDGAGAWDALQTNLKNPLTGAQGDNGNYYTSPSQVKNNTSADELFDLDMSDANKTNWKYKKTATDYYQWELTPAKVAYALDKDVKDIQVVHMSSEELCTSKADILGNYDLVYVGGNTSALKSVTEYGSFHTVQNNSKVLGTGDTPLIANSEAIKKLPVYTMYSHFGDFNIVAFDGFGNSGGITRSGSSFAKVWVNGSQQDSFLTMNGNDISDLQYKALKSYLDAGMPVIVSKTCADGYNAAATSSYLQNAIDPDSNMFKFLKEAYSKRPTTAGTYTNVCWGFDEKALTFELLDGGRLGTSKSGYAQVFADGDPIAKTWAKAKKRPQLVVKLSPKRYSQYDDTTKLSGTQTWVFDVKGATTYDAKLYIDNNGNSKFESGEEKGTRSGNTIKWDPGEFFGPVYWQLEVTANGTKSRVTGICYIKPKSPTKQTVKVLQIIPSDANYNKAQGAQGATTLYFCPVCDQASFVCGKNPASNAGTDLMNLYYGGNYAGNSKLAWDSYEMRSDFNGIHFGTHEHRFGIVKYDSALGYDDFSVNLADELKEQFNFDLDIWERSKYEQIAKDVHDAYDISDWTAAQKTAKIQGYAIDKNDADYAAWSALTDDDARVKFILQKQYENDAKIYKQMYLHMKTGTGAKEINGITISETTADARKKLDTAIGMMKNNTPSGGGLTGYKKTQFDKYADWFIEQERYYDYFNYCDSLSNQGASYDPSRAYIRGVVDGVDYNGKCYLDFYNEYAYLKDKELEYKELYEDNLRKAAEGKMPGSWLKECYNCVIIGPAEDFNGDDIGRDPKNPYGLDALIYYVDHNGNTLLFHELLTKFSDAGSYTFTKAMRARFGMDRYQVTNYETAAKAGVYYVDYDTKDEQHFISNLSYKPKTDTGRYAAWLGDMQASVPQAGKKYFSALQYTDMVAIANNNSGNFAMSVPYRYVNCDWGEMTFWNHSHGFDAAQNTHFGTNRASRNNEGIVTLYPFTLSDELNISGTHSQSYAVDIESPNMTVWYSLAGGYNAKKGSSFYAADPRDGMDNYFMYTYGNVNYCGAGHSFVTGKHTDNNDERKFYINIICNSVRKSVDGPVLNLYDYDTETNSIVKTSEGTPDAQYTYKVDEDDEYPEFSFKVSNVPNITLVGVQIYYDLDYSESNALDAYSADKFPDGYPKHVMIADWDEDDIKAGRAALGVRRKIFRADSDLETYYTDPEPGETTGHTLSDTYVDNTGATITFGARALKLKPRYFSYYNNEYTYIVVCATYVDGETGAKVPIYKRMKIKLKPYLYDLT